MSLSANPVRAGEPRRPRAHSRRPGACRCVLAGIGSRTSAVLLKNTTTIRDFRSNCTTIAPMMLAPCSASSMLSASLRPGRWPGLRALTTPARGTDRQLRDGGRSDEAHNDVDDDIAQAYVGLIPSVPHGTPPVRHNGIRSAHSADAPKGTAWSASLTTSQPVADHRQLCTPWPLRGVAFSGPRAATEPAFTRA